MVPAEDARACRERARFTVEAIEERERTTNHDVAAFVDVVSASIGAGGQVDPLRADVLRRPRHRAGDADPRRRGDPRPRRDAYRDALVDRALEQRDTVSVGRTHGIHAEPTSFGLRLAGFAFEADRNVERLAGRSAAPRTASSPAPSGPTPRCRPAIEAAVMERLGLAVEDASTQIIPRDRHAELLSEIALAGAGLERFATEIRNLQRTEVREVEEPFGKGQKGSSAMPHKRNPITTERITGSPGSCAAMPRPGSRTSRSGTSGTSRTRAPSG